MKTLIASVALLFTVSALAGIPYVVTPTNSPISGQQIFSSGVTGYNYWGWGTNAQSSNATVISASASIGVITNGANYTPFFSASSSNWIYTLLSGATNEVTRQASGTTNEVTRQTTGTTNYVIDATNAAASYARTLSAADTNNDLAVSNKLWLQITNVYVDVGGNGGATNVSGQTIKYTVVPGGGGGATNLTPWTTDINAATHSLTNLGGLSIGNPSTGQYTLITGNGTFEHFGTNQYFEIDDNSGNPIFIADGSNAVVRIPGTVNFTNMTGNADGLTNSSGYHLADTNQVAHAQTNDSALAASSNMTIVTNTATPGKTLYTLSSSGSGTTYSNITESGYVVTVRSNLVVGLGLTVNGTGTSNWMNGDLTLSGGTNYANYGYFTNGVNFAAAAAAATTAVVSTIVTTPLLTNQVAASNVYAGGQLPLGTVSTNSGVLGTGAFLTETGDKRAYSLDGSALTNKAGLLVGTNTLVAATNDLRTQLIQEFSSLGANVYSSSVTNALTMTNNAAGETGYRTNIFQGWVSVPTTAATNTTGAITVNAYVRHYVSTNTFAVFSAGPINVVSYMYRTGSGTVSGHYEFYAVDSVSGVMTELATSPAQVIPTGTGPVLYQFPMSLAVDYTPGNPAYAAVAFRIDQAGASTPQISFVNGTNYDAHMSFVRPLSSATITMTQVAGLPAALANGTNYANLVTNRPALLVDQSNVLSAVLTFPSATNSLPVYAGGADWLLQSATPTFLTNATGATAGYRYAADITVSNSTAAAFTNRFSADWKARGYWATNQTTVLGIAAATVPASAEMFVHVETRGTVETNYWISY